MSFPQRGQVFFVNLDPAIGSEIKKTRPAVIVQNDVGNQYSSTTIIAPITSGNESSYPIEILVRPPEGGLKNKSLIKLDQIRAVDKRRLVKYLGKIKHQTMKKVDQAIAISLGLIEF